MRDSSHRYDGYTLKVVENIHTLRQKTQINAHIHTNNIKNTRKAILATTTTATTTTTRTQIYTVSYILQTHTHQALHIELCLHE